MSLSGKERRFITAYGRTGDAGEAAKEAGYKDLAGARTAKRIFAKEEARAVLSSLRAEGNAEGGDVSTGRSRGEGGSVSLESLTEELEEARRRAVNAGQSSAAIAATMGKAKLHGLDHPANKPKGRKAPEKIERVIVDPENSDG